MLPRQGFARRLQVTNKDPGFDSSTTKSQVGITEEQKQRHSWINHHFKALKSMFYTLFLLLPNPLDIGWDPRIDGKERRERAACLHIRGLLISYRCFIFQGEIIWIIFTIQNQRYITCITYNVHIIIIRQVWRKVM